MTLREAMERGAELELELAHVRADLADARKEIVRLQKEIEFRDLYSICSRRKQEE